MRHEEYAEHLAAFEDMLAETASDSAPWTVIEAHDHRDRSVAFKGVCRKCGVQAGVMGSTGRNRFAHPVGPRRGDRRLPGPPGNRVLRASGQR